MPSAGSCPLREDGRMRLADVVAASTAAAATRSRKAKVAALAEVLAAADAEDLPVAAHVLTGQPRQGKVDVGYRTLGALEVPAADAPTLTLADLDAAVDRLAAMGGAGVQAQRRTELAALLGAATPDEQAFLRGLLLGELRQGALEGLVVQAVAAAFAVAEADVRRAQMLRADIGAVAVAAAAGGSGALRAFRLVLFQPVQPMLATTATSAAGVVEELGTCAVEAKLDGARIQVHRDGDRVAVYSRSLRDISAEVPEVVRVALDLPADRVILDGEVLAVDADGRPAAFQDTMSGLAGGSPFFFDCLLQVDDAPLIDRPLRERITALEAAVPAEQRVDRWVVQDADAGEQAYTDVLADGHEGVVVKDLDSVYEAGRRGAAWRKVKPVRTLDLVVLAAEWGSGRRRGWLSNLHLGARDDDRAAEFVMLGKTFKGLTDEVLAWQTTELLRRETHRSGHVVHVRPELVVEIALDGVVRSPRYPGGVALRFARVVRYRPTCGPTPSPRIGSRSTRRSPARAPSSG
jgi:DNA ligase 1